MSTLDLGRGTLSVGTRSYLIETEPAGYVLRRTDGGGTYHVGRSGRYWSCDCPDARYRRRYCKHVTAVRDVLSLIERLTPEEDMSTVKTRKKDEQVPAAAPAVTPACAAPPPAEPEAPAVRLARRLAEPFPADAVGWKPQNV